MTISDDFNRADASLLGTASDGGTYTYEGGTLGIVSNAAVVKTIPGGPWFGGFAAAALRNTSQADVDFTAVVNVNGTDIAVMPFGYDPVTRQGYYVRMITGSGAFHIYRINGDTATNLASGTIGSGARTVQVTRVAATGSMEVFVGGVSTLTATDTTYPSSTWVGVGSGAVNGASFDSYTAAGSIPVIPPRPHRPLIVSGAALSRAHCW